MATTTRITLADYIRRNLPLIPPEDLCRNVGLSTLNDAHMIDEITVVEINEAGKVVQVYKPKLVSTVPPEPEPQPEPTPPAEEPQSMYDRAAERIFPSYEDPLFEEPAAEEPEEPEDEPDDESE